MEMFSKNFNEISKGVSSAILVFLFLIATVLVLINIPNIFAQYETQPAIMNASIHQVIGIELSNYLAEGILFTNTTTIGVQYPITNVNAWNNATRNYNGSSYGTLYNITAWSANQVNVTVCHCACSDLTNVTGGNTYYIYINGSGIANKGVGWANGTTATFNVHSPPDANYIFKKPLDYQIVSGNLAPGNATYLRYWLNPYPNDVPSGIYNTTYKFKAVEIGQTCGICSC
jgi:hypothetical protein